MDRREREVTAAGSRAGDGLREKIVLHSIGRLENECTCRFRMAKN